MADTTGNNKSMAEEFAAFIKSRKKTNLAMVLINIAVFIVLSLQGNTEDAAFMLAHGACYAPYVQAGEAWRLFTSMFLHFGIVHLLYNMLCLIYLGDYLESAVGPVRYLIIYLVGGLAGNVLSVQLQLHHVAGFAVSAGASGAIFACIGALLWVALRAGGQIGIIRADRLAIVTVLMVAQGFMESGTDNAAHVGGVITGFLLCIVLWHPGQRRTQ